MPRLAANLSLMFTEHPFLERFAAAARAGFKGVEFLFPYAFAAEDIRHALLDAGLQQVLFNLPPGDWNAGERGLCALPGREADFDAALALAHDYARVLGCRRLHVMAGITVAGVAASEGDAVMVRNLRRAAGRVGVDGISLLLEAINQRDMPGYHLSTQAHAERLRAFTGCTNVGLQFDLYHCQITEGDLEMRLRRHLPVVAHVQIAGVPHRQEPDCGEVNYLHLLSLLDQLAYPGWVGCEYRPAAATLAGLGWAGPYGIVAH